MSNAERGASLIRKYASGYDITVRPPLRASVPSTTGQPMRMSEQREKQNDIAREINLKVESYMIYLECSKVFIGEI